MTLKSVAHVRHDAQSGVSSNVETAVEQVRRISEHPGKGAFVARALHAVARIATETDERSLVEATGASSDYDVLLQALETPNVLAHIDDRLAGAKLRGLRYRERLLTAEGGVVSAEEAATILCITRQGVDKRRRAGNLIGLSTGRRGYAYPIWQFHEQTGALPGLVEVLAELREHDPWMQLAFMLNGNDRLAGETPLHTLRQGEIDRVKRAARTYGEHGAA